MKALALILSLLLPLAVWAESRVIHEGSESGFSFSLSESRDSDATSIYLEVDRTSSGQAKAFFLRNPLRAVIDLPPTQGARHKTLEFGNQFSVRQLRIGAHPDKTRLVMELFGLDSPQLSVEEFEGKVIVTVKAKPLATEAVSENASSNSTPTATPTATKLPAKTPTPKVSATSTPRASPTASSTPEAPSPTATTQVKASAAQIEKTASVPTILPTVVGAKSPAHDALEGPPTLIPATIQSAPPTATPTATRTSTPTPTPSQTPTADPTATHTATPILATAPPTHTPSPEAIAAEAAVIEKTAFPQLSAIEFTGGSSSPLVRLKLSQRGEFKLSKTEDKLYKLFIPGSKLSQLSLTLPQFPPSEFTGITYLQANQREDGVEIKIGVDRGNRIMAFAQDSDIMVKVAPNS